MSNQAATIPTAIFNRLTSNQNSSCSNTWAGLLRSPLDGKSYKLQQALKKKGLANYLCNDVLCGVNLIPNGDLMIC